MTEPKFSIIIPVYNVETYLTRCIDSILSQTFSDFECILVDDGSTDSSGAICDEYAKKDSRVKAVHQENQGSQVARNTGLDVACGQYIEFIDSDDWIEKDALELFYKILSADETIDMLLFGYRFLNDKGEVLSTSNYSKLKIANCEQANLSLFTPKKGKSVQGFLWNKIFKRKQLEENNIRFNKEFRRGHDWYFLRDVFKSYCIKKFSITNEIKYNYFFQESSASHFDFTTSMYA